MVYWSKLHPMIAGGQQPIWGEYSPEKTVNKIIASYTDKGFLQKRRRSEKLSDKGKLDALGLMSLEGQLLPGMVEHLIGSGRLGQGGDRNDQSWGEMRNREAMELENERGRHQDIDQVQQVISDEDSARSYHTQDAGSDMASSQLQDLAMDRGGQAQVADMAEQNAKKLVGKDVASIIGKQLQPTDEPVVTALEQSRGIEARPYDVEETKADRTPTPSGSPDSSGASQTNLVPYSTSSKSSAKSSAKSSVKSTAPISSTEPEESEQVTPKDENLPPTPASMSGPVPTEVKPKKKRKGGRKGIGNIGIIELDYRKKHGYRYNKARHEGMGWKEYKKGKSKNDL